MNAETQQQPSAPAPRLLVECPRCKGRDLAEPGTVLWCSSAAHREFVRMRPVK